LTMPPGPIIWIKVEKPVLDLVGVVLSSFKLAGLVAVLALALGGLLGYVFICRHRRPSAAGPPCLRLEAEGGRRSL